MTASAIDLRVTVTEEDIVQGARLHAFSCPVALAITRALRKHFGNTSAYASVAKDVYCDTGSRFSPGSWTARPRFRCRFYRASIPDDVADIISNYDRYDAGGSMPQFSFVLHLY